MTLFWMALFITRPWEILFPELAEWHIERLWALTVIATVVASGTLRLGRSFQTAAVLLFLGSLTLSSLCALDGSAAWEELYKYMTLVVFYFILLSVIRTPYHLLFVAASYIVVMAAYLAKAEYEHFVYGAGHYTMGVSRLIGIETTYGDPNSLAASCVLSLPIVVFLWRARKPFTETWPRTLRTWFPVGLALYFLLALTAIVLTNSRSGMLGFAVFAFLTATAGRKLRGKLAGLAGAAVVLAAIWAAMPAESKDRLRTVWDPSRGPQSAHASAYGRIEGMIAGLVMFERFPLTGVGIGNFIPYRVTEVDGVALDAHSLIGEMLGETGLVGAVGFLLLVAAVFINCRKTESLARAGSHPTLRMLSGLALACRTSTLLLIFFGLFGHNMLRFNWLWLAAFALLAKDFCTAVRADEPGRLD